MNRCPDCTLPVLANEEFCRFCNRRLKIASVANGRGLVKIGARVEAQDPPETDNLNPLPAKITLDLPKGSSLEMAVRRYVTTAVEQQGVEIMRLKDVIITAEYEARP